MSSDKAAQYADIPLRAHDEPTFLEVSSAAVMAADSTTCTMSTTTTATATIAVYRSSQLTVQDDRGAGVRDTNMELLK